MVLKPNAAFLLAQVGAHSAEVFAELLEPLRLAPQHSGIIWMVRRSPGISQQNMAATLRMHPSRLVSLLDELEERGYVERRAERRRPPGLRRPSHSGRRRDVRTDRKVIAATSGH